MHAEEQLEAKSSDIKGNGKLEAFFFTNNYRKIYGKSHEDYSKVHNEAGLKEFWAKKVKENKHSILGPFLLNATLFSVLVFHWGTSVLGFFVWALISSFIAARTHKKNVDLAQIFYSSGAVTNKKWLEDYFLERHTHFLSACGVDTKKPAFKQQESIYHFMSWALNLEPILVEDGKDYTLIFNLMRAELEKFKNTEAVEENNSAFNLILATFQGYLLAILSKELADGGSLVMYSDEKNVSNSQKDIFANFDKVNQQELLNKIAHN